MNLQSKNTGTWTQPTANTGTFSQFLRHGKYPDMATLADFTFESVVLEDGTQLKDLTFAQLGDAIWSLQSKN